MVVRFRPQKTSRWRKMRCPGEKAHMAAHNGWFLCICAATVHISSDLCCFSLLHAVLPSPESQEVRVKYAPPNWHGSVCPYMHISSPNAGCDHCLSLRPSWWMFCNAVPRPILHHFWSLLLSPISFTHCQRNLIPLPWLLHSRSDLR